MQAADGYYRILGRVDDVINVSGHRLGTKELESAALMVDELPKQLPSRLSTSYVATRLRCTSSLKPGLYPSKGMEDKVIEAMRKRDRQNRPPQERVDCPGHAENPFGKDHAPSHRRYLQLRRCR